MKIWPVLGVSNPAIIMNVVVLPDPPSPKNETKPLACRLTVYKVALSASLYRPTLTTPMGCK